MNICSKCAYLGLSVSVFVIKDWFCLSFYSWGRFLRMFVSGFGFSSMSPCWRMSVELFQVLYWMVLIFGVLWCVCYVVYVAYVG